MSTVEDERRPASGLRSPGLGSPGLGSPDPAPRLPPWPDVARTASDADEWRAVLIAAGLTAGEFALISERARRHGVAVAAEALAAGAVSEEALCRAFAARFGLAFQPVVEPDRLIVRDCDIGALLRRAGGASHARLLLPDGRSAILVAPGAMNLGAFRALLRRLDAAERLRVVTPSALRAALLKRGRRTLLQEALSGLAERFPQASARQVLSAWQGALLGASAVGLGGALVLAPAPTILVLHLFFTAFFLACVCLRLAACPGSGTPRRTPIAPVAAERLPVYSVLVALRQEAQMIPDLLIALGKLRWPRAKLEIKLVCEADDGPTLEAIAAHRLRPSVEVIRVPPGGVRTKPRALAYALPLTTGEFVVLYDAEDRPDPDQLIEAWLRFSAGEERLACLQAPLFIANGERAMIARLFAFEYAALFRGMLPWLARRGLPVPLGGTSNHFRRSALELVGGWDPYNVTEDADLGLRLSRFGFRTAMLTRPTYEDAPETLPAWFRQRTRWFKGWQHTYLVHMRAPRRLFGELGPAAFAVAQIVTAGQILSAIAQTTFLLTIGWAFSALFRSAGLTAFQSALLIADLVTVALGYASFLALGWRGLSPGERRGSCAIVLATPLYFILISAAAWRAIWKLARRPHYWEKTPHIPHRNRPFAAHGQSPRRRPAASR